MSRPTRSSVKLPFMPKFVAKILSHASLSGKHRAMPDASLEAAIRQISFSLTNLDFDHFFKIFAPHTPVYQFIETLDFDAFHDSLLKAFPIGKIGSSEARDILEAKNNLDEDLVALDCMFKRMEDKGLDVGNIRSSLSWVRKRNNETYADIPEVSVSTSSHGKSSKSKAPAQLPSQRYLAPPPDAPAITYERFPDEVSTFCIPVPPFNPDDGWPQSGSSNSYEQPPQPKKRASQPLASRNAGHRERSDSKAVPFPTMEGKAAPPPTYARSKDNGKPSSNPSHSHVSNHSRPRQHDVPPAHHYAHYSDAPPSPPRRHECYPVSFPSQRPRTPSFSRPHHHQHHQGYYDESNQNAPFIPPPPSTPRSHQSPRHRR